jgi:predicted DNA-binding antitoxin AbrB/MazE fold protein
MSEHIQAIYENGVLRPLQPLDLPENSVVEIDVRDV